MPGFYMPSKDTQEYIEGLVQGFFIELSDSGEVILLIKVEPSISDKIIKGCPIELFVVNPNVKKRTTILYIYDSQQPYHIIHSCIGNEDSLLKGFDELIIKLALKHNLIKLVLINSASHCFFTATLATDSNAKYFDDWLFKIFNDDSYINPKDKIILNDTQGASTKGFSIMLQNKDHTEDKKTLIISPIYEDEWLQNAASIKGVFNHDHYKGDGKHGYQQEFAITSTLTRFFELGINFFPAPKLENGLELSDYLVINNNAAILLESKYVISEKTTKKHKAIQKAINQLNDAEIKINNNATLLDNSITQKLKDVKVILKICLVNDQMILTDENTKEITSKFLKEQLPIFITVSGFFSLLTMLGLKNPMILSDNLFFNIIRVYKHYLESGNKICFHRGFSLEGLTIEELNELSLKRDQMFTNK